MRGKYKFAGMVAVILTVIAAGSLMLHLMDTPTSAVAENNADGTTNTIVDENGETVADTRTDADLEAMYQAGVTAYEGDRRYIDYVIDRTIEDAPDHVTLYGKTFGLLENGETFGRVAQYVDEDGHLESYDPDYQPTASTSFASDGALVWIKQSDLLYDDGINTPGEACYAASHNWTYRVPLYKTPGGEIYEYKTMKAGGEGPWGTGADGISQPAPYLIVTLVDNTQFEVPMQDYLDDPSILDGYDIKYIFGSTTSLEEDPSFQHPGRDRDYDSLDGTHLLVHLRDGSIVDILLDDYYADPSILEQYNIRDIIRTEKSLAEYEAMGVAEELFW